MEFLKKSAQQHPKAPTSSLDEDLDSWKIAIIDDEQQVHAVTKLVLGNMEIDGKPLKFLDAYSAKEGLRLFQDHPDIALAFIDVIMEEDDAGLNLIHQMRNELQNHTTRIVLRTGQPGMSPEETIIRSYDINDYKSKTELTDTKLKTCAYSCIRSYRDIVTIDAGRQGVRRVIDASDAVLRSQSLHQFGNAILTHTVQLLGIDTDEIYLVNRHEDFYGDTTLKLLAATGAAIGLDETWDTSIIPAAVREKILHALDNKQSSNEEGRYVFYYRSDERTESVLYTYLQQPHSEFQANILKIFATNMTLIFQNLSARESMQEMQQDLLLIMSDAIEQRSKETGSHVRRVAMMSELMALKIGMTTEFADIIRHASPLHDIGKIAIPEHILHKPGKLDPDEWELMKTHTTVGYELLKNSKKVIAKMGARIAYTHHEHWDGGGYPRGIAGEEIPLEGRIVAIVDVIDALGSTRSYKKPWNEADIRTYIRERRGRQFDPDLVDAALDLFPTFKTLRRQLPD